MHYKHSIILTKPYSNLLEKNSNLLNVKFFSINYTSNTIYKTTIDKTYPTIYHGHDIVK